MQMRLKGTFLGSLVLVGAVVVAVVILYRGKGEGKGEGEGEGMKENFQSRGNPYNQRGPSFFQSYAFRLGKQRMIDAA